MGLRNNLSAIALESVIQSSIKGLNDYLHDRLGDDKTIRLCDIGNTYNGLSGKCGEDFGFGFPYITYLNVYKNSIVDPNMVGNVTIGETEVQNITRYGDALFTLSSETACEVGVSAICLDDCDGMYLNSFCFGYRLHDFSILNPTYLPYCFSSSRFRRFILPFAQGSTRYNLNKSDFVKSYFKTPTIESQIKIANVLNIYTQKIHNEKGILSTYNRQKEYLLQNLFI
ncbi:MAG: restriction endonuclease subunit S [Rikenellaceae bacterium]